MKHAWLGKVSGLVLIVLLLATACGGDEPADPGTVGEPAASAEPTKAGLVEVLKKLQAALDAKDYATGVTFMVAFPGMTSEQMQTGLAGFVDKKEISAGGIDILEEKAPFGPLLEIFPKRGDYLAKKAGVDAAACWALSHEGAEVAAHWDGKAFHLIRLDDVGKLD